MLEMLLFFLAVMTILFIGLYFIEVEPYRKKGLLQRIGELLLYSYCKICEIAGYGIHYLKIKVKSIICNYRSNINAPDQKNHPMHSNGHHRHVDSSENMYCRNYDYNLKILK